MQKALQDGNRPQCRTIRSRLRPDHRNDPTADRVDIDANRLLGRFLQLLHHFIHVEARRLLTLRKVPERHQELADIVLRGNKQEGVIKKPVVIGVRGALSRCRRSVAVNIAGNRRHVAADAPAQVRNEPARSSLKCGRRST